MLWCARTSPHSTRKIHYYVTLFKPSSYRSNARKHIAATKPGFCQINLNPQRFVTDHYYTARL